MRIGPVGNQARRAEEGSAMRGLRAKRAVGQDADEGARLEKRAELQHRVQRPSGMMPSAARGSMAESTALSLRAFSSYHRHDHRRPAAPAPQARAASKLPRCAPMRKAPAFREAPRTTPRRRTRMSKGSKRPRDEEHPVVDRGGEGEEVPVLVASVGRRPSARRRKSRETRRARRGEREEIGGDGMQQHARRRRARGQRHPDHEAHEPGCRAPAPRPLGRRRLARARRLAGR